GSDFDLAHTNAFHDYHLPVLELEPDAAAHRIAGSAIRAQLQAALVDWTTSCIDPAVQKKLSAVLRLTEGNSWEHQLWEALETHDNAKLVRLAHSEEVLGQPPAFLDMLGTALSQIDKGSVATEFLRKAHQSHPDDYWINHQLARYLLE